MSPLKQMIVDFEYNASRIKFLLPKLLIDNFVPYVIHDLLNNRILIYKQGYEKTRKW